MKTELKKYLKCLCICAMMLAVFGCKSREEKQAELQDIAERTLSTTTYNYTKYELYGISFMDVSKEFDIQKANGSPSVLNQNGPPKNIGDGIEVRWETNGCCFLLGKENNKKRTIKVVWNLIYDSVAFKKLGYDARTMKESAPGTVWCEAIVEVAQPLPLTPDTFYLHFFSDGTVLAHVSDVKDIESHGPLPRAEIKKHLTEIPLKQYCQKKISNPWYGIPRKPHME